MHEQVLAQRLLFTHSPQVRTADTEAREVDLPKLRPEKDRLLKPVDAVLTDEFKPRLEALLTTTQRETFRDWTATRPARPGAKR